MSLTILEPFKTIPLTYFILLFYSNLRLIFLLPKSFLFDPSLLSLLRLALFIPSYRLTICNYSSNSFYYHIYSSVRLFALLKPFLLNPSLLLSHFPSFQFSFFLSFYLTIYYSLNITTILFNYSSNLFYPPFSFFLLHSVA